MSTISTNNRPVEENTYDTSSIITDLFGDVISKSAAPRDERTSDSASDDKWRARTIRVARPSGTRIPRLIRGITKGSSKSAPGVITGAATPPSEKDKIVSSRREGKGKSGESSRNTSVESGDEATAITFRVISADIETTCQITEFGSVVKGPGNMDGPRTKEMSKESEKLSVVGGKDIFPRLDEYLPPNEALASHTRISYMFNPEDFSTPKKVFRNRHIHVSPQLNVQPKFFPITFNAEKMTIEEDVPVTPPNSISEDSLVKKAYLVNTPF